MLSEDQIVAQILSGQTCKYRMLVEHYQQPVFRFARNLIGDEHEAEDIAQEVFLAAFAHLTAYNQQRASLLTWLLTITRNRCLNHLKRKRPLIDGNVIADTYSVEKPNVPHTDFWRQLDEALDALPIDQKTAFVLAEIEELPYADIAIIEQTTLGTVKSRIHRAKQRLRIVLAPSLEEQ